MREDEADPFPEGRDGTAVRYTERLWAPLWLWLLVTGLVGLLAVAYGAAYGVGVGAVGMVAGTLLCWIGLVVWSPLVRVDDRVLRAGRARLPLKYTGEPELLNGELMRDALRNGDARTFVLRRPWTNRGGICVAVTDDDDPHPRWLVASKRPQRLADAVRAARAQLGHADPAE
ncbi:MAG: DUF3093 family protein [Actinomycetota bacterium]